eukprot:754978-Hanusia_phi.AAC.7
MEDGEGWAWLKDKSRGNFSSSPIPSSFRSSSPTSVPVSSLSPPPLPGPSPAARAAAAKGSGTVNKDKLERSIEYKEILPKVVSQPAEIKKDPREEAIHLSRQVARYASLLEKCVQDLNGKQEVQESSLGKKDREALKMNDLVGFGVHFLPLRALIQVVGHFLLQKERRSLINLASVSHSVRDATTQMVEAVSMDSMTSAQAPQQGLRAAVSSGVTAVTKVWFETAGVRYPSMLIASSGAHVHQDRRAYIAAGVYMRYAHRALTWVKTKVEELEDLVNGLKKEREQLYAQVWEASNGVRWDSNDRTDTG